jgi:hypothetical protein
VLSIELALSLRTADLAARECGRFKDGLGAKFWLAIRLFLRDTRNFLITREMFCVVAASLKLSHIPRLTANRLVFA